MSYDPKKVFFVINCKESASVSGLRVNRFHEYLIYFLTFNYS